MIVTEAMKRPTSLAIALDQLKAKSFGTKNLTALHFVEYSR
jgi:hypothetical protein